jgi:hypothetical protein
MEECIKVFLVFLALQEKCLRWIEILQKTTLQLKKCVQIHLLSLKLYLFNHLVNNFHSKKDQKN